MKTLLFLFAVFAIILVISSDPIPIRYRRNTTIQCNQGNSVLNCTSMCQSMNSSGGYCNSGSCVCGG